MEAEAEVEGMNVVSCSGELDSVVGSGGIGAVVWKGRVVDTSLDVVIRYEAEDEVSVATAICSTVQRSTIKNRVENLDFMLSVSAGDCGRE